MALIKCKKCGKEISDRATSCIHCGCSLEKEVKYYCAECGNELKNIKCDNCGYENKALLNKPEKVTNIIVGNNKKSNAIWYTLCIIFLGIVVVGNVLMALLDSDISGDNGDVGNSTQEEKLDGIQGTWAAVDRSTGVVDRSHFLELDGKGNCTQYISGYGFELTYTISDKVYFKDSSYRDSFYCNLRSTPYSDGTKQYRLECYGSSGIYGFYIKQR